MSFRLLIAGPRHFTDYPALRAARDALLMNRLPDVELLTCGGRGVPMLAASYATERGLVVTARVADFVRFPVDAVERRDAFLVNEVDAVVVVWADRDQVASLIAWRLFVEDRSRQSELAMTARIAKVMERQQSASMFGAFVIITGVVT